jgi:hypothetical protein
MEESKRSFEILAGKPRGKEPFGMSRRRWEDNIRIYLKEIATTRNPRRSLVNVALNIRVP